MENTVTYRVLPGLGLIALLFACLLPLRAQESETENAITALQARLDRGETQLAYDETHGYLPAMLKALGIPEESQVLPFSKSSFQFSLISPHAPRAVYFRDDVSVAGVLNGRLLEIMVNNPKGGVSFYTFPAQKQDAPRFQEEGAICIACHGLVGGRAVGWMVANITTSEDGMPQFPNPSRPFDFTDDATPFELRWGGWYVTGTTGSMRHRGNVTSKIETPYDLPVTAGLNLADLSGKFDRSLFLQPGSDVVALLALEHQTGFFNRVAALNVLQSEENVDALVSYMTFADEIPLPDPVKGSSNFTARFESMGPRDVQGRSLRDFDLKTRMFRHPLSYMIYSAAFDGLKPNAKATVWRALRAKLQVTAEGRDAMAIVAATKAGAPADWKTP
jgi:hypothetical protein